MKRLTLFALAVCLAMPAFLSVAASVQVDRGIAYIRTTQQLDGGFGGFGDGQTFDAVFAIRSAGIDPTTVKKDGKSPADFLAARANAQTTPGAAAKAAMAAIAMNMDPRNVNGVNLVARITTGTGSAGQYGTDDFTQSLSMIALRIVGEGIPGGAAPKLLSNQLSDGGWGFGGFSDPDTTALAIQALVATNGSPPANSVNYLKARQLSDGGWGFSDSNANSTAFVIQALIASGVDPNSADFNKAGKTPLGFLNSQQQPDGSFLGFDPAFATNQALPALAGRTFLNAPSTPIPVTVSPTAAPPVIVPTPAQASPTATVAPPPAPATVQPPAAVPSTVPAPPATGSGKATSGNPATLMMVAAFICIAISGTTLAVARRRGD